VISLIIAWTQPGSWFNYRLWILGTVMGVLLYVAIVTMVRANRLGPPSLPWTMANLALVVPVMLAALFLKEKLQLIDGVSLAAFGGMLLAFGRGSSRAEVAVGNRSALVLLLILVLLTNGFLMFGFKLNSLLPAGGNTSALHAIMYGTGCLLAWLDECRKPYRKYHLKEVFFGGCMGIGSGIAILLLLLAMKLPAVVVFPVVQGISLLGGICITALIYREHLNRWKITGVILGLAVILLSVWR
jgi:multidrug transporter EmrE-like cation transporter